MSYDTAKATNDPLASSAWHLIDLDVMRAHKITKGDLSVIISQEITGFVYQEDLAGIASQVDSGGMPLSPSSDYHSAFITGMIFAEHNNGRGIVGMSPDCTPHEASALALTFIERLQLAVDYTTNGYRYVYSASSGTLQNDVGEPEAVAALYATGKGLYFNSAGNDGGDRDALPYVDTPEMFYVGVTYPFDMFFPYGNFIYPAYWCGYGNSVKALLPGNWLISCNGSNITVPNAEVGDSYAQGDGTSYATPILNGIIGLIWTVNPSLTTTQVLQIVEDCGDRIRCSWVGLRYGTEKSPNVYKSLLKAQSMLSENSGKIFPYIKFHGAFTGDEVSTVIDPATSLQTTTLDGKVLCELNAYGASWTQAGTVTLYADDTVIYTGPPTVLALNNSITAIDSMISYGSVSGSGFTVGNVSASDGDFQAIKLNFPSVVGVDYFEFTMDFTGANSFLFDLYQSMSNTTSWFEIRLYIDGTLITSVVPIEEVYPNYFDTKAIDASAFTGDCIVRVERDVWLTGGTPTFAMKNFRTTADYLWDTGFVWDVTAPETRNLRLEATTDGGEITETVYFAPDLDPPVTENLLASEGSGTGDVITLQEIGTDDSQPVTIQYQWGDVVGYHDWVDYTAPFALQVGVLWWRGVDALGNKEVPQSRVYTADSFWGNQNGTIVLRDINGAVLPFVLSNQ